MSQTMLMPYAVLAVFFITSCFSDPHSMFVLLSTKETVLFLLRLYISVEQCF